MRKMLFSLLVVVFSFAVLAEDANEPLDPDYDGIHGMVVINNASGLYASHLPLYEKPHNAQIIYKIEAKDNSLVFLVRDADLVTIKPEKFNLQKLMRGERLTVKADVYLGHYERGGTLAYEQVEITFSNLEYLRMLERSDKPVVKQVYDSVPLKGDARLLIHQIQGVPSYDHILLVYEDIGCITEFYTTTPVPAEDRLISRLSFCGSMKPLHYETSDFAK